MWMRWAALAAIALAALAQRPSGPWRANQVLQPADLAAEFRHGHAPTVFMVGPRVLYNGNHIRGALFAGPAGNDAGAELKRQAERYSKDAPLVIYCGCCPMDRCPNIRPAFTALQKAGYGNMKILELAENLKANWTDRGYPVEKGEIPK